MKLNLAGAFLPESGWTADEWTTLDMVRVSTESPPSESPEINACVFKLNIMRTSEQHLEVFIGASVGSISSRSWISGTDPAIATSKSEGSATNGS